MLYILGMVHSAMKAVHISCDWLFAV